MPWRLKTPPFEQFILGSLWLAIFKEIKHLDCNYPRRPLHRWQEIGPKYLKIVPVTVFKVKD